MKYNVSHLKVWIYCVAGIKLKIFLSTFPKKIIHFLLINKYFNWLTPISFGFNFSIRSYSRRLVFFVEKILKKTWLNSVAKKNFVSITFLKSCLMMTSSYHYFCIQYSFPTVSFFKCKKKKKKNTERNQDTKTKRIEYSFKVES